MADLTVVRSTLLAALDAGCDDRVECAGATCCPLPFADIVTGAMPQGTVATLPPVETGSCRPEDCQEVQQ